MSRNDRGDLEVIAVFGLSKASPWVALNAMSAAAFVLKTEIKAPEARSFTFDAQKTMYGGRRIAVGDTVFLFASETEGGAGLVARGVVTTVKAVAPKAGIERQTPRVSLVIERTAKARRRLGRAELKPHAAWKDGRPETELNFKFYRQATNKLGGISRETATYLEDFF